MTKMSDLGAGDISADLAALREDILRLTEGLAALARDQANTASATLKGVVGDAKAQASQAAASAQDSVVSAVSELERRIEKSPLSAVLLAAFIGMAFGIFSRSRR